jgi:hypothetical protein
MRTLCLLCLVLALALWTGPLQADTITFDDLPNAGGGGTFIPNGYHGLNWSNFSYADGAAATALTGGPGYKNGIVSGRNVAFNAFGIPSAFSDGTFTLNSGYFTAAFSNEMMTVAGYLNGVLQNTVTFSINTSGPVLETFNWSGINEVRFTSGISQPGSQFVLDNLVITAQVVPEPLSLALLATVLLGLLPLLRRRVRE